MDRDDQMKREAITLPEPISTRGSYSSPGYYVIDQSGHAVSDRYDSQALAYANLHGGAGVQYLDQPEQGHLNQPWPPELHTVVGHAEGGQMYTEADLLRAMASTSDLDEQRYLMSALEEVRREAHQATAAVQGTDTAPPHHVGEERPFYPYHSGAFGSSSATDWLADMGASDDGMTEHMLTMGSRFFIGCHPEVKADAVEFMTQALGVARVAASQFANIEGAVTIFMEHVANLGRVDMSKLAVDQLLPWESPPEQLPPTDSNYTDSPYSPNQNDEAEPYPGSPPLPGLDNGASGRAVQGSFPGILSSHQHMSEFLFDPPSPEELAAASGPGNLDKNPNISGNQDDSGWDENGREPESGEGPAITASLKCACVEHQGNFVLRDGSRVNRYIDRRACQVHKQAARGDDGRFQTEESDRSYDEEGRRDAEEAASTDPYQKKKEASRAFSPEPTSYEEYLSRLAPGSASVSQEFYSGAMAAHSPSQNDPSVPAWGRRERPKASVTQRPSDFRGVTAEMSVEDARRNIQMRQHLQDEHGAQMDLAPPDYNLGDVDNPEALHHLLHWTGKGMSFGPQHSHEGHIAANEDMLNPQAFERADESDAPSIRGTDGTGTYNQKDTWTQSGEAAHEPTGLIPQTDLSENFSNISDFPDTGDAEVPSTRAPFVGKTQREAMKWSPASGMTSQVVTRGDNYGDFTPTHTYNPIGWDQFDSKPHPGSNPIAPGSPVQLHGKMSPDGFLVHVRDEDGNHQTVDQRSITKHRPGHEGSVRMAAEDDDDEGKETGGPQDRPGAYEPDRSQYAESPEGQAEATRGYEEAYSSGRMIDFTGAGVDVLGTVPVQGYAQDAERPNGEMWAWQQQPIGSPPRGAADVADVPTAGMVSEQATGNSYPQPNVSKNARLDAWRANIAARMGS